jgi:uncharacterized membrane protein YqiK
MSGKVADAIAYRGLFFIEIILALMLLILIPLFFKNNFYNKNGNS